MKKIIIFCLIGISISVIISFFCKEAINYAKNGVNQNKNTEAEELQKIRSISKDVKKNKQGFWEADFGNGLVMIYIPSGSFQMGNSSISSNMTKNTYSIFEEHKVNLSAYWIAKTPVTVGQFRQFVNETGYVTEPEKEGNEGPFVYDFSIQGFMPKYGYNWDNAYDDILKKYPEIEYNDSHPVSAISWNDAIAYVDWISSKIGLKFTLPTEAEWEYAARSNDGRIYPWGKAEPDETRANYADDSFARYFPNTEQSLVHHGVDDGFPITSPVGYFVNGESPFGALDMSGNLTEWIYDSEYEYTSREMTNPICANDSEIKMQKGGFWAGSAGRINVKPNEISEGHNIRSDFRQGDNLSSADDHLGFRISISYTVRE